MLRDMLPVGSITKGITDIPYISVYKSRNLSQNKILHRQFVLYTGNTLREEIIPKAS